MKTILYDKHRVLGAKMVEFFGWEMPIQYKGIIPEHHAVREKVGLFDVSHMGRILIFGPDAECFLDYLSTNKISGKKPFTATYTVLTNSEGGCVDDVIIYKIDNTHFFTVVNAGNREKDLEHFLKEAKNFDVVVQDRYDDDGILAIQGPKAIPLMTEIFPEASQLKLMRFVPVVYEGTEIILSGTGYTGAGGFEIYAPQQVIDTLWDRILEVGQRYGIEPVGLGARDTLRLEMGYALYGHEIDTNIAPTESVSAWTVRWKKGEFIGRSVLEQLEKNSHKRSEYGIVLVDKGIAREGYKVYKDGKNIGYITSGTFSPSLNKSIAIILVQGELQEGEIVDVQIRKNLCCAQVVPLPFYKIDKE